MSFKFERLDVWKRSIAFADEMFTVADGLPSGYQYSLGDWLRRAALSIPTNIAEGSGRDSAKESRYFYRVAKGSAYEVISLLVMVGRRKGLSRERCHTFYSEANELASMLSGLTQ